MNDELIKRAKEWLEIEQSFVDSGMHETSAPVVHKLVSDLVDVIEATPLREHVIVLEDGAEPQVGDIVQANDSNPVELRKIEHGKASWVCRDFGKDRYDSCALHYCKIIQRNGKPVIYQSALKGGALLERVQKWFPSYVN